MPRRRRSYRLGDALCVSLPTKVGQKVVFTAQGTEFQLKKKSRNSFFLARNTRSPSASRWGDVRQIREDLEYVCNTGSLPPFKGWWA